MAGMLYRPGEAARRAGIAVGTLRLYCKSGLLEFQVDSSGMRLFTDQHIEDARAIYQRNIAYRAAHQGRGRKASPVMAS